MIKALVFVLVSSVSFCSVPDDNPGHHNHWGHNHDNGFRNEFPAVPVRQIQPAEGAEAMANRRIRMSNTITNNNNTSGGVPVVAIIISLPSYDSLSGDDNPVSASNK